MSALGGILRFDGGVVDKELLLTFGNKLAIRGPDGGTEVCSASVGMAYRAFHTNQESRCENQPLVWHGKHILCWDGRLDNREELIPILRSELCDDRTDAAIVMSAYLKWGMNFVSRIIGDYALSLWDPCTHSLLFARDPFGTRTLFYAVNKDKLMWSSELAPLLQLSEIQLEINDEYVAGYLLNEAKPCLTPYKGAQALEPGNILTVRDGEFHKKRFWKLEPKHEIRYRSDGEYEEHFRQLFRDAVRCRLRADGPVWAELSGGLDSTSIVCMADKILRSGEAQAPSLETASYVFEESPTSDERTFIHCVEEKRGKASNHFPESDQKILAQFADESIIHIPNFLHCFAGRHRRLEQEMLKSGGRVLLSGQGGDHLLWSVIDTPPDLADLLFQFRLLRLHRRIKLWSAALKRPYLDLLFKGATVAFLPRGLQAKLLKSFPLAPWLDKKFFARMKLSEQMPGPVEIFGFQTPSSRLQSSMLLSIISWVSAGYYKDMGCVEVSYPFLHQPLVEFLIASPIEQKLRPAETRSIMRRSLRDVLPERIIKRKNKRGPSEAIYHAIIQEWPKLKLLLTDARVCARGYVDRHSLAEALERARHGREPFTVPLIKTISLELWLRSLERRREEAITTSVPAEPTEWQTAVRFSEAL